MQFDELNNSIIYKNTVYTSTGKSANDLLINALSSNSVNIYNHYVTIPWNMPNTQSSSKSNDTLVKGVRGHFGNRTYAYSNYYWPFYPENGSTNYYLQDFQVASIFSYIE